MSETREDRIKDFHRAFGLSIQSNPTPELLEARRVLIEEEVEELFSDIEQAISLLKEGKGVPRELYANMLKEMADLQVVLSGMSVALEPLRELEEAFKRVCDSNMSKLGDDGKPLCRSDGKVLKGPNYQKPDLSDLV